MKTGGYHTDISVYALKADGTFRVWPPAGRDKDIATGGHRGFHPAGWSSG